ncbi:MAG: hypothetical protein ACYTX0_63510, partial [Nostoc sp.]
MDDKIMVFLSIPYSASKGHSLVNHSCGLIKTSSEFLFFVLPPLVLLKGQTVMQIMRQNIIGCGLQVLQ